MAGLTVVGLSEQYGEVRVRLSCRVRVRVRVGVRVQVKVSVRWHVGELWENSSEKMNPSSAYSAIVFSGHS